MPLSSSLVGRRFGPIRWDATARRLLAYRAALAPTDRAGLNDSPVGGLCASPTQAATPEWQATLALLSDPSAAIAEDEARRGVHVDQESAFLHPIREGDALETTIDIKGLRNTRSGALMACVFETRRLKDGELLVRTKAATLYRGVETQEAGNCPRPQTMRAPEKSVAEIALPYGFAHVYSECAEIWNPIHTEQRIARAAGLNDMIVHGTALWAKAGLALCSLFAHGETSRLASLSARFAAPVAAGESVTLCVAEAAEGIDYALRLPGGAVAALGHARFSEGDAG